MAENVYYGKYEYLIDGKNRIRMPNVYEQLLGDNVRFGEGKGK